MAEEEGPFKYGGFTISQHQTRVRSVMTVVEEDLDARNYGLAREHMGELRKRVADLNNAHGAAWMKVLGQEGP